MTREEAVQIIRKKHCSGDTDCSECCYIPENCVYAIAIEALRFRTPKEFVITPLKEDVRIGNMTCRTGTRVLAKCPNCDAWVMRHHRFCSTCGQAIDWSEEE